MPRIPDDLERMRAYDTIKQGERERMLTELAARKFATQEALEEMITKICAEQGWNRAEVTAIVCNRGTR